MRTGAAGRGGGRALNDAARNPRATARSARDGAGGEALRLPPLPPRADGAEDCTWAYTWPSGRRLAEALPELVDVRGRRVADLGCGRGHCGLRAAQEGAAEVLLADGDAGAVAWLGELIALNGLTGVAAAVHAWGDPLPGAPFDVILGGDILYRPPCFAALLASIAGSLAPTGVALLADPRQRLDAELPALAAAAGLGWMTERRDGWTLVRLRPALDAGPRTPDSPVPCPGS